MNDGYENSKASLEEHEQIVNAIIKKLLDVHQALAKAISEEHCTRRHIVKCLDHYRLLFKQGASLLFASKKNLTEKNGELSRYYFNICIPSFVKCANCL